jgi:hypothetical protein
MEDGNDANVYYTRFEKYKAHYEEWCKFSAFNIKEKATQAVHEKQWITARLNDARRDKLFLTRRKNKIKNIEWDKVRQLSPVDLDKTMIGKINKLPSVQEVEEQIEDLDILITYLAEMSKMLMYVSQDVKNVLDAVKIDEI